MVQERTRSAGQVLLIPNEQIFSNPHQPRRVFDQSELVNLAISIRMNGILQPITVRECEKGYELVSPRCWATTNGTRPSITMTSVPLMLPATLPTVAMQLRVAERLLWDK